MTDRRTVADPFEPASRAIAPKRAVAPARDLQELIEISNRLRQRSHAVQQAAAQASALFRDLIRRSVEVCGK